MVAVVGEVLGARVGGVVAVPGGEVDPKAQAPPLARFRHLLDHVSLALSPGAVGDRVFGEARWPEAKTIVMLACEDERLEPRGVCHFSHPVGVKIRGVEHAWGLVPVAPLLVCEGVDGEVEKPVALKFVPLKLARAGCGAIWFWNYPSGRGVLHGVDPSLELFGGTHPCTVCFESNPFLGIQYSRPGQGVGHVPEALYVAQTHQGHVDHGVSQHIAIEMLEWRSVLLA